MAFTLTASSLAGAVASSAYALSVSTGAANQMELTNVVLYGTVTPIEGMTECFFEYGTSTSYGSSAPCAQISSGMRFQASEVWATVQGLATGTYHFRLVAADGGPPVRSGDSSFVVKPAEPRVRRASEVGELTATLNGTVEFIGELSEVSSCFFEYGPTSTFAQGSSRLKAPCSHALSGSVSAEVSGLQPDTRYSYTLVIVSLGGAASEGEASEFVTSRLTVAGRCMSLSGSRRAICLGRIPDWGISIYHCPGARNRGPRTHRSAVLRASAATTSEAGWPRDQCLKMDKGKAGEYHTIVGQRSVHNWLLGGFGNDTIIGGESGDVIWADYQEFGWPEHQTAIIRAGNGRNVIYANDTVNYVWTGSNPNTVVHAHEDRGVIHCQNPNVLVYSSRAALAHWKLYGCGRISFYSVGY